MADWLQRYGSCFSQTALSKLFVSERCLFIPTDTIGGLKIDPAICLEFMIAEMREHQFRWVQYDLRALADLDYRGNQHLVDENTVTAQDPVNWV